MPEHWRIVEFWRRRSRMISIVTSASGVAIFYCIIALIGAFGLDHDAKGKLLWHPKWAVYAVMTALVLSGVTLFIILGVMVWEVMKNTPGCRPRGECIRILPAPCRSLWGGIAVLGFLSICVVYFVVAVYYVPDFALLDANFPKKRLPPSDVQFHFFDRSSIVCVGDCDSLHWLPTYVICQMDTRTCMAYDGVWRAYSHIYYDASELKCPDAPGAEKCTLKLYKPPGDGWFVASVFVCMALIICIGCVLCRNCTRVLEDPAAQMV
jgi:hypothetical protein